MDRILQDKQTIKTLCIGDTHIGSSSGLLHPHATAYDGEIFSEIPQNKIQRWLWKNLLNDLSIIGKVDVIVDLGDNVEGLQTKIIGRTLATSDVDTQKQWAVDVLQKVIDMCKPKYFLGVTGTNYHVRINGASNVDIDIYKKLEDVNQDVDFIYADNLIVKMGELTWSIAHPYPTTEYQIPPLEKLIRQHATEYYLGNSSKIKVFVRGHSHHYNWVQYRNGIYAFTVPCQQPTSAYSREKAYMTVRHPDVGILAVTQEENNLIPQALLHRWR